MSTFCKLLPLAILFIVLDLSQAPAQSVHALPAAKQDNFASFSRRTYPTPQALLSKYNAAPLPPDANFHGKIYPSASAMEIFSRRTRDSKYFIEPDSPRTYYSVKSLGAINYLKDGQWLTIDERLSPKDPGVFEADHQEEPVGFDVHKRQSYIKTDRGTVFFNQWSLYGENAGKETLLARADWSHYTAGDDGLLIINIFPGIDAEMKVFRGAIKTNFIIHRLAFPGYRNYRFKDSFADQGEGSLTLPEFKFPGSAATFAEFIIGSQRAIHINRAVKYNLQDPEKTAELLSYTVDRHQLCISLEGDNLIKSLAAGDLVVDPFVSSVNSIDQSNISGSLFNADCSLGAGCVYTLSVPYQRGSQIIDVRFSFDYIANAPCTGKDGSFSISTETCTYGNVTSTVSRAGVFVFDNVSIFSALNMGSCLPAPSCDAKAIQFKLSFARTCKGAIGCDGACIGAVSPFSVVVRGDLVLDIPAVKVKATQTTVCAGQLVSFTAEPTDGGPTPAYTWLLNGNPVGTNSPAFQSAALKNGDSLNCVMQSSLTGACTSEPDTSEKIGMTVHSLPDVSIIASASNICQGDPVSFTVSSTNLADKPIYQWSLNGNIVGNGDPVYENTILSNGDTISCQLISGSACAPVAADQPIGMTVKSRVSIVPGQDKVIRLGDSVLLDPAITGNVSGIAWEPPAGLSDQTIPHPNASPDITTRYILHVLSGDGCLDSTGITVKVVRPFSMPNAFTPNHDGKNDVFRVPDQGLLSLKDFSVYNRWGQRVFYTSALGHGWDGTYNGKECPAGTYVYQVHGAGIKGQLSLSGTVELIR